MAHDAQRLLQRHHANHVKNRSERHQNPSPFTFSSSQQQQQQQLYGPGTRPEPRTPEFPPETDWLI